MRIVHDPNPWGDPEDFESDAPACSDGCPCQRCRDADLEEATLAEMEWRQLEGVA